MNIALIKNAELYTPQYNGFGNILIINDKIAGIGADVSIPDWAKKSFDCLEIDARHHFVSPGLIDAHVHITGGGSSAGTGAGAGFDWGLDAETGFAGTSFSRLAGV